MFFLRRLYTFWCLTCFFVPLLLFFPFFLLLNSRKKWHNGVYVLNKIWARIYFFCCFIPISIQRKGILSKNQNYVFCGNHTSYLDIVAMGLVVHQKHCFVGKDSLGKIPVFGAMFKRLHISVNRASKISSYRSMVKMNDVVKEGKSLVIFPEGGIISKQPPKMSEFKEGAFRIAIDNGVPIVPVSFPYNWILLKDDGRFLPNWHELKIIIHEPIPTKDLTLQDIEMLKKKVFDVIQSGLTQ